MTSQRAGQIYFASDTSYAAWVRFFVNPHTLHISGQSGWLLSHWPALRRRRSSVYWWLDLQSFCRKRMWSGREDSNLRPYGPEPYALPSCATPRSKKSGTNASLIRLGDQPHSRIAADPEDSGDLLRQRRDREKIRLVPLKRRHGDTLVDDGVKILCNFRLFRVIEAMA